MAPTAKYLVWYEYRAYEADRLVAKISGPKEDRLCYCEKRYIDVDDPSSGVEPCYCQKRDPPKELMECGIWIKPGYQETATMIFGENFPAVTGQTRIIKYHIIERNVGSGR